MINTQAEFQRKGIVHAKQQAPDSLMNLLTTEYQKPLDSKLMMHYNHLAGLHNPWGKSAHLFDSWGLLEICKSETILELIKPLIGPDIILWESSFYGYNALNRDEKWMRHSSFSPIAPMQGVVVRITIDPEVVELEYLPGSHAIKEIDDNIKKSATLLKFGVGSITCHDIRLVYRYSKTSENLRYGEYVIHYMPATSLFIRDSASHIQRYLAEKLPLINYGRSPIWLVSGSDHRNNDFVTGFLPPVGQWTNAQW